LQSDHHEILEQKVFKFVHKNLILRLRDLIKSYVEKPENRFFKSFLFSYEAQKVFEFYIFEEDF
jgi:hypothetical protein